MKALQILGLSMMGWAILPTPDDASYLIGGVGAIKDVGLFATGAFIFWLGSR